MTELVVKFPFDLTGQLLSNAVSYPIVLGPGPINRAFAFPAGPFFADTLRITPANNPTQPLVRNTDYQIIFLHPKLTKMSAGLEVNMAVVITNPAVSTNINVSAQIVGGPMGAWVDGITQAIDDLNLDNRVVDFSTLRNLPETYAPAPSYKDIGDLFGFEYVIAQISSLTDVINSGDATQVEAIKDIFDSLVTTFQSALSAHVDATGNVHSLTAHQINTLTETEIRSLVQGVQSSIDATIQEINNLKTSDTQINARIDGVVSSMAAWNLQLTTVNNNYQKQVLIIANLQAEIAGYRTEVMSLEDQVTQLTQQLAATNAQVSTLSQQVTALSNTVTTMGAQITALQQGLATTNSTFQSHLSASDPHPNYLHKQLGGTVNASVRVNGNMVSRDDVQAEG